ncbi:hypothetical protein IFR05_012202 [Cadophora sp. M221]|nr:hypothetical protein IFR05_012202 [Cadophora sp. M221]
MNNTNQQATANIVPASPTTLPTCPEPGCGLTAATHRDVINHWVTAHKYVKPYQCTEPGCGESYVHKGDRNDHVFTKHRGGKKWRCLVLGCAKAYIEAKKVLIRNHFAKEHPGV